MSSIIDGHTWDSSTPERIGTAVWTDPEEIYRKNHFRRGQIYLGERVDVPGLSLGYLSDGHVLLCSETGGGKGERVIINNLGLWPGAAIVFDPKGGLASIMALRRGKYANDYCEPMGQECYVFDPLHNVIYHEDETKNEEYRKLFSACLNPLDQIDPTDEIYCLAKLGGYARILLDGKATDDYWADDASSLLGAVMLYVLASPLFEEFRDFTSVYELLEQGDEQTLEHARQQGQEVSLDAMEMLFHGMKQCEIQGGFVKRKANYFANLYKNAKEQWQGVVAKAKTALDFMKTPAVQNATSHSDFSLRDLKDNPQGVSFFVTLPQEAMKDHKNLMRLMIEAIGWGVTTKSKPKTGHEILFVIDELQGLERIPTLENQLDQKREEGIKFLFSIQRLSKMKEIYQDAYESFIAACPLRLFFDVRDPTTKRYISETCGFTEKVKYQISVNKSTNKQRTTSESQSEQTTKTNTKSTSETSTQNQSITQGQTKTQSTNRSTSQSKSKSIAHGETQGLTITQSISNSIANGTSLSRSEAINQGFSQSQSITDGKGHNQGNSRSITHGSGRNQGNSYSNTSGSGSQSGRSIGRKTHIFGWALDTQNDSQGLSRNLSTTNQKNTGQSTNKSLTHQTSQGSSQNQSVSNQKGKNQSKSLTTGNTSNHTKTNGITKGSSEQTSKSVTSTATESSSVTVGEGESHAINQSETEGSSLSHGKSESQAIGVSQGTQTGTSQASGSQEGTAVQEAFHRVPLLQIDQVEQLFSKTDDPTDERYPGLALVLTREQKPFPVRLVKYHQSETFYRRFGKDPMHDFKGAPQPWYFDEMIVWWERQVAKRKFILEFLPEDVQNRYQTGKGEMERLADKLKSLYESDREHLLDQIAKKGSEADQLRLKNSELSKKKNEIVYIEQKPEPKEQPKNDYQRQQEVLDQLLSNYQFTFDLYSHEVNAFNVACGSWLHSQKRTVLHRSPGQIKAGEDLAWTATHEMIIAGKKQQFFQSGGHEAKEVTLLRAPVNCQLLEIEHDWDYSRPGRRFFIQPDKEEIERIYRTYQPFLAASNLVDKNKVSYSNKQFTEFVEKNLFTMTKMLREIIIRPMLAYYDRQVTRSEMKNKPNLVKKLQGIPSYGHALRNSKQEYFYGNMEYDYADENYLKKIKEFGIEEPSDVRQWNVVR